MSHRFRNRSVTFPRSVVAVERDLRARSVRDTVAGGVPSPRFARQSASPGPAPARPATSIGLAPATIGFCGRRLYAATSSRLTRDRLKPDSRDPLRARINVNAREIGQPVPRDLDLTRDRSPRRFDLFDHDQEYHHEHEGIYCACSVGPKSGRSCASFSCPSCPFAGNGLGTVSGCKPRLR
jgi:hypothetical protein